MKDKCVMNIAFRDMQEDLGKMINPKEVWNVRPQHLTNKKTRYLNYILGLRSLNHIGNTNGIPNKTKI